jgi:hypothetical protein
MARPYLDYRQIGALTRSALDEGYPMADVLVEYLCPICRTRFDWRVRELPAHLGDNIVERRVCEVCRELGTKLERHTSGRFEGLKTFLIGGAIFAVPYWFILGEWLIKRLFG